MEEDSSEEEEDYFYKNRKKFLEQREFTTEEDINDIRDIIRRLDESVEISKVKPEYIMPIKLLVSHLVISPLQIYLRKSPPQGGDINEG